MIYPMDTMTERENTPRELPLNPSLDCHLHRDSVHLKDIMTEREEMDSQLATGMQIC